MKEEVEYEFSGYFLCPICGRAPGKFRDELSVREHEISGLCQRCQDSVFGEEDL